MMSGKTSALLAVSIVSVVALCLLMTVWNRHSLTTQTPVPVATLASAPAIVATASDSNTTGSNSEPGPAPATNHHDSTALPRPAVVNAMSGAISLAKAVRDGSTTSLKQRIAFNNSNQSTRATLTPEERARRYWTSRLQREYAPFFQASEISPENQDAVLALLLENRLTLNDIYELGRKHALTYEDHSKLRLETEDETTAGIKARLSDDQLTAFKNHKRDLIVEELTTATIAQFHAARIAYSPQTPDNIRLLLKAFPPGQFTRDPITTRLAKKHLTPEQVAVFESVLDRSYARK